MNERLKEVRLKLKLSQEIFGQRIGMTGGGVSHLENGKRNITEQVIKLICKEFDVDYIWFTTGTGEMFSSNNTDGDADLMVQLDTIMTGEPSFLKNLFITFLKSDKEDLKALEHLIDNYLKVKNQAD